MSKNSTPVHFTFSGQDNDTHLFGKDFSNVFAYLNHETTNPPENAVQRIMQFCQSYKVIGTNKHEVNCN